MSLNLRSIKAVLNNGEVFLPEKKDPASYSVFYGVLAGTRSYELIEGTGVNDLNGDEIFVGDLCQVRIGNDTETGTIVYDQGCFLFTNADGAELEINPYMFEEGEGLTIIKGK